LILKLITIETAQRHIRELLAQSSDSPQLDAELLLEKVTGLSRSQQRLQADNPLTHQAILALTALTERRQSGEPLAYVLGEWGFWTLRLQVTSAVLVPRPETELVVQRALLHLPTDRAVRVLDLGTGSGAIALAVATERPLAQLTASDASLTALAVARSNASQCTLTNVEFVMSDWFAGLPLRPYALIASNPPYIAEGDPHLEPAVLAHEPHQALFAGASGMEALQIIVREAPRFLQPGGWLVLEHGWQQAQSVRSLLESAGFSSVASHADLGGHERVTEGCWT
jgi:release factor glutamine methyltransferase